MITTSKMQKRERDVSSSASNRSTSKSGFRRSLSRENSVGRNELQKGPDSTKVVTRGGEVSVSDFMKTDGEEQET